MLISTAIKGTEVSLAKWFFTKSLKNDLETLLFATKSLLHDYRFCDDWAVEWSKSHQFFLLSGFSDYSGRHAMLFTHLNFKDFIQAHLIISTVFIFPMRSQHAFAPRF